MKYKALLEGLEVCEKKLSEVKIDNQTFRFDSEFFSIQYLEILRMLNAFATEKLEAVTTWITQGPNPNFTEDGTIPCLTGRNINHGRVIYENADFVSEQEYNSLSRFQLEKGDTLITLKGKGSIGKIGFVTEERNAIFSRNIGIVRPNKGINAAYLNAYILSKFGQKMVLRGETGGTGQSTLTCSYLKSLNIPRIENEELIGNLVWQSEKVFQSAQSVYSEAESYLLECLGMTDFAANPDAYNVKTLKESFLETGRLDAEYYLPKYEELTKIISSYPYGCKDLKDIVDFYRGNFISDTNYTDTGIPYLRGGDISSNRINDGNIVYINSEYQYNNETICNYGDIVFAMIGSVGTAAIITKEFVGAYISNNLGLLRPKTNLLKPEVLHIFLTSAIGKMFFEQRDMVTAQPKISFNDMSDIPVPILRQGVQDEIARHVQRSFALRKEAMQLLENAKLTVEQAIENGGGNLLIFNKLQKQSIQEERYAEWLLLTEIGVLSTTDRENKTVKAYKKLSDSFLSCGRLDAEYYQPKYDYLFSYLSEFATSTIGELTEVHKSIEPGSDAYQETGVPFIRVSDLSKFGLSDTTIHLNAEDYNDVIRPQKDTILLSKDGSVGIAYKVEEPLDVITSGAILHLSLKSADVLPDYLTLVLNSPIVRLQAERDAGGSIIQHWKPSEIENVVIPILPMQIQQEIADKIRSSFKLRKESQYLLDDAKRMVEMTIEGEC